MTKLEMIRTKAQIAAAKVRGESDVVEALELVLKADGAEKETWREYGLACEPTAASLSAADGGKYRLSPIVLNIAIDSLTVDTICVDAIGRSAYRRRPVESGVYRASARGYLLSAIRALRPGAIRVQAAFATVPVGNAGFGAFDDWAKKQAGGRPSLRAAARELFADKVGEQINEQAPNMESENPLERLSYTLELACCTNTDGTPVSDEERAARRAAVVAFIESVEKYEASLGESLDAEGKAKALKIAEELNLIDDAWKVLSTNNVTVAQLVRRNDRVNAPAGTESDDSDDDDTEKPGAMPRRVVGLRDRA